MMSSIDGRIVVDHWPDLSDSRNEYERTAATFAADGWMCGRVTMQAFADAVREDAEIARDGARCSTHAVAREDFRAPAARPSYAIAVDPSGRLLWRSSDINGDHIVTVLGAGVSDDYLTQLRTRGVSYVLAAAEQTDDVDLAMALEKLAGLFGVRTLLLEGGGRINGGMLRDGLVDEVSLLIAPATDGAVGTPALFDVDVSPNERAGRRLALESVERRTGDVLWLRYRVEPATDRR
jgi:riboflavin biosynthesis pyrimidine reductase